MNNESFTLREKEEEKLIDVVPSQLNSYYNNEEDLETAEKFLDPYELTDEEYLKIKNEKVDEFVNKLKKINSDLENLESNCSTGRILSKKSGSISNILLSPCKLEKDANRNGNLDYWSSKKSFNMASHRDKNLNIIMTTSSSGQNFLNLKNKKISAKEIMAMNFIKQTKTKLNKINLEKYSSLSHSNFFPSRARSTDISRVSNLERLYYRGMVLRDKSIKSIRSLRDQVKQKEMKECTFTPKMNKNNIILNLRNTYSGREKLRQKVVDYLATDSYRYPSKFSCGNSLFDLNKVSNRSTKNFNIRSNKKERSELFEKFESFSNRFNAFNNLDSHSIPSKAQTTKNIKFISKSVDKMSTTSTKKTKTEEEIFQYSQKLFNDAEKYKFQKEKLSDVYHTTFYPFHPSIADKNTPSIYNFFYRLQKWVDKRNEKYENDLEKANYDTKTGLRLFSPSINQYSHTQMGLNEKDKSKCLTLYNQWKQRRIKEIEDQERYNQEVYLMSNISHTDSKSKEISNDLVKKIFTKIFSLLLLGVEGNIITGSNHNINSLPQKIIGLITPLLNELKEQNETLTLEEFILACHHIYAYLPFDEKQFLNEWFFSSIRKKNLVEKDLTFKPMIDKNSQRIAKNSNKYASNFYLRAIESLQKGNKENSTIQKKTESKDYLNKLTKANVSHPSSLSISNQLYQKTSLMRNLGNTTKNISYIHDTA